MGGTQLVFDGTTGDDTLVGNSADNYLNGMAGNDLLKGAEGNDTYLFNKGDGQDVVLDIGTDKHDAIHFGAGIAAGQVQVKRGTARQCRKARKNKVTFSGQSENINVFLCCF